ncbi:V-type ATP synthase subunit A [Streptomyces tropicalis]|uniref:V-type ATP synthase subunit A n=1 Tax=Streptomyces tropicalis TaxID=3034234 RepID=A0ABT6AA20_9ACTN|nr:V-type ATP synthase subunit A [Streptomyces tropicalis]MDF3301498.1 V-type ATP synthase subunit A [Streptomyces tropicalis]
MGAVTPGGVPEPSVVRVAGPLVEFGYVPGVAMHDLVLLGPARLPGEVVAIRDGVATAQAYAYTGSLAPGHPARPQGHPLTVRLGPALLGGVFDGLLRPLDAAGDRLLAASGGPPPDDDRTWPFTPRARAGDTVAAGDVLGDVPGDPQLRILVPAGCSGPVQDLAPAGRYRADDPVAVVGGTPVHLSEPCGVRTPRPVRERLAPRSPLVTGQRVIDLLFPVARGGTVAVPGGFGTGKTMLLHQIAKWCDADVIVYVGCGERGNEMAEVIAELSRLEDPRTGGLLADRTVVVANTSDMPMMAREAGVHTAATVAEYFRDMGLDVVVIADSTSRWAEALREFAARMGELPAEEGYPAGLASELAAFYERAAVVRTLGGTTGSVTLLGAVSPPGGDFTEPVTAHTERFVRCLWALDRDLAYARHYPAVSWADSFSRDAAPLARGPAGQDDPDLSARRARVTRLLAEADRLADLVELVGITALPPAERMSVLGGRLLREGLLQQSALSPADATCSPARTAALADAVLAVADACARTADTAARADSVEEVDFTPLLRAREEAGPRETAGIAAARDTVLARLKEVR